MQKRPIVENWGHWDYPTISLPYWAVETGRPETQSAV